MKLKIDLVRKLLFYLEQKDSRKVCEQIEIDGYDSDEIAYHLCRMAEKDLIVYEATRSTTNSDRLIEVFPFELTWDGHEFLDAARNEDIWNRAKQRIAETVGAATLDIMKILLVDLAKDQLGLKS